MSPQVQSVCIIDDDKFYINLVSKIIELKQISEKVIVFNNGKEAMDYFIGVLNTSGIPEIPQVILLDLNMPVMDGWEFLEEFSKIKNQIPKHIDLYVVSSSIDYRDIQRAKSIAVVMDYITKPIAIDDFTRILE